MNDDNIVFDQLYLIPSTLKSSHNLEEEPDESKTRFRQKRIINTYILEWWRRHQLEFDY